MSALRKVAGSLCVLLLSAIPRYAILFYRSRWFFPCLALTILLGADMAVWVKAVRHSRSAVASGSGDHTAATPADREAPSHRNADAADSDRGLRFSTTQLNLGDGKPNQVLRGLVTLTNPGSETTRFVLVKSCGCTELSPRSGELKPGTNTLIQVSVQLPNHANSEKNASIEALVGSPPTPAARCVIQAHCPAPFQVTPGFVNLGSLASHDLGTAFQEININTDDGQPALLGEKLSVEHANSAFRVERLATSAAHSVVLRVGLAPDLGPGDLHDTLELRLARSEFVMRVPLHVTVTEPIAVVPATVFLRRDREGPRPLTLVVTAGKESLGSISLADGPDGLQVEDMGELVTGRRRIRLTVVGDIDSWPERSRVWLSANGLRFPFTIVTQKPS